MPGPERTGDRQASRLPVLAADGQAGTLALQSYKLFMFLRSYLKSGDDFSSVGAESL